MPKVGKKHFPYTKAGMKMAMEERDKMKKMERNKEMKRKMKRMGH